MILLSAALATTIFSTRNIETMANKPVKWAAVSARPVDALSKCILDNMPVQTQVKQDGDDVVIALWAGGNLMTTYTIVRTDAGSRVERRGQPFIRKPVDQCLA